MYGTGREEENRIGFVWVQPFPVSVFVALSAVLHKAEGFCFFQRRWKKSTHVKMGQQLLEEQREDLHYGLQHSQKYGFLPGSAVGKWTDVYGRSQK